MHHGHGAQFREIADFKPSGSAGMRVATTSTTKAHLLVSGIESGERTVAS
jgi:hypothetical protein